MSLDFTKAFFPDEPESPSEKSERSVPDEQQLSPEQLAEAERVAAELVKLHRDGAIKTKGDASFCANLIRDFGATYAGNDPNHPNDPPVDRVPQPPYGISPQERIAFYKADLDCKLLPEVRKIIYTTNAIESLHMQLRKVSL